MTIRLRTTAAADEAVEQIDSWWRANRLAAPDLFLEEFAAALALLVEAPDIGAPYPHRTISGVRRFYLTRTRYHVYYVHDTDAGEVVVLMVWSSVRGSAPALQMR
ncbi:MAG: type II toxin-antitoxin system RelE/ParE family toxin [Polyangiaceae bacterium]|nr:type II toxin-antitoxin system RelE/ParE family toxin [Polyangiaceae bacterium]